MYRTFLEGFKALRLQSSCLHKYTQINEFSNIHVPFTLKNQKHTHLFVLRRRVVVVVQELEFAPRNSISLEILEPNNQPVFSPVGYHFSDRILGIGSNKIKKTCVSDSF
jgi:hypothetical protein